MENILQAIGRKIDDELMKSYFGEGYILPSMNRCITPTLKLDDLRHSIQKLEDDSLEYTREFWRELAQKYGPHTSAAAHIDAVLSVENAGGLNLAARPNWLQISPYLDATNIIFFICECLCHTSIGKRRLTQKDEWCCQCSMYEDI